MSIKGIKASTKLKQIAALAATNRASPTPDELAALKQHVEKLAPEVQWMPVNVLSNTYDQVIGTEPPKTWPELRARFAADTLASRLKAELIEHGKRGDALPQPEAIAERMSEIIARSVKLFVLEHTQMRGAGAAR